MKRFSHMFAVVFLAALLIPAHMVFSNGAGETNASTGTQIPVTDIVLYNTGVGFFQRSGTVTDTTTVDMVFEGDSVNDLLKSLVVRDIDGGIVSWVNYASREPAIKTMQNLSVNLASNPPFLELLSQLRGETVSLEYDGGGRIMGVIVGIERSSADDVYINILDSRDRIIRVAASDVRGFRSENPAVREELERALVLLAESKYKDAKRVSFRFTGEGERRVQLGYVLPVPVWKASYRLVIGDDENLLQAWAIIENLTREDWDDITLVLVSGLPIAFEMDLYRPIEVQRPTVDVDIATSVAPPRYEGADRYAAAESPEPGVAFGAMPKTSSRYDMEESVADLAGGYSGFMADGGVESAATGARSGEFFQYRIREPISLARSESGMVPISSGPIGGEKLSIYNSKYHQVHPLHSFRIENDTDLDFVGGPVTVIESGAYAGDAQLGVLRAGESRLLSYAVDLDATVDITNEVKAEELVRAYITAGELTTETKTDMRALYRCSWNHTDGRMLMIEHAISAGWDLVEPEPPDEKTASYYRFTIDPAATPEFTVAEKRLRSRRTDLKSANDATIRRYIDTDGVSLSVRNALQGILDRREGIERLRQLIIANENRRSEIFRDQQRIRENLEKITAGSEVYERYLEQLSAQEDELEIIVENVQRLNEEELAKRRELDEYIRNLQAE